MNHESQEDPDWDATESTTEEAEGAAGSMEAVRPDEPLDENGLSAVALPLPEDSRKPKRIGTDKRSLSSKERRKRILELRKNGATFQQIADSMGITVSTAHYHVQKGLEELAALTAVEATELRAMIDSQYDDIIRAHAMKKEKSDSARVLLSALEGKRKLHGVDKNEEKLAEAARVQAAVDAVVGQDFVRLMDAVCEKLGMSWEQREQLPSLVSEAVRELGLSKG